MNRKSLRILLLGAILIGAPLFFIRNTERVPLDAVLDVSRLTGESLPDLLQRIRDEAHRFAITAHRRRRTREGLKSELDAIPGIGPKRRNNLLKHFGSVDKIRQASMKEIAEAPGLNEKVARAVKDHLE